MIVASHFEISGSVNCCARAGSRKFHRALPVTGNIFCSACYFLLSEFCFCAEKEIQLRHGDIPLNRIRCVRGAALPNGALRLKRKIRGAQMRGFPGGIYVGSCRKRIGGSVLAAKNEKHQLGFVFELNAEPIPAGLFGGELMREKFVIHPREAGNRKLFSAQQNRSICGEARLRKIVAGVARSFRFLAYAIFSMDYGRLFTFQGERKLKFIAQRYETLCAVFVPQCGPISVTDFVFVCAYASNSRAGAIDSLGVIEMAAVEIA